MNNLLSIEDFLLEQRINFTPQQIKESLEYLNSEDPELLEAWYNTLLDFAALIPGVGSIAEGINLVSYAKQGEYLLASLCAVGLIPIFGQYIGAGGTLLIKALRSGSTLGGKILKPLINLIAKFFPKITALFKSSSFLSKFSGISPFIGRMIKSLKDFVMSGGKSIDALSKNASKIKELTQVSRELKRGVKVGKAFFGGKEDENKIPVPKEAFAGYQGSDLKNVRPYSDQEISQAGNDDWARYLA
jgi:hypothetical protein